MNMGDQRKWRAPIALLAAASMTAALAGCGNRAEGTTRRDVPPPVDDSREAPYRNQQPDRPADEHSPTFSTKQKVVVLAGAAALYYLYKHHQKTATAAATGPDGQYYISKNGRVYYRDAEHRAHWVTPPSEGIQVPESEAREYQSFQGYDNRATGRDLSDVGATDNP